jgi:RHS repeat-associated protein
VYTYGPVLGRTATVADPMGNVTSYAYTAAGRLASVTNPLGQKTTLAYDSRGNPRTVVSPGGNVPGANPADYTTTYTYDFNNNRVRLTHAYPGGGTVSRDTRFDELNRITDTIDELGNTYRTGYDNNGNVVSAADPLGGTSTVTYDVNGRPSATTAPAGGTKTTEYDAAGNVIKVTTPTGGIATYTYDDDGRIASVVDPRGNAPGANPADYTARYGYDAAGNLNTLTDQLGRTTRFTYDSVNRITGHTDAKGHSSSYRYDDGDRMTRVIGPDGDSKLATVYAYDDVGHVTSRTDPSGNSRYTYDKLGQVTLIKDPLNRDTTFTYDAEGNLTTTLVPGDTDPATRSIVSSYDILNRRMRQMQAGTLVYNYGYDANNRMTSLTDPTGVRTQTYDALGRLATVTRGSETFNYGYDANGNVTSRRWPDGTTVNSTYDASNRLSTLTAVGGLAGPGSSQYTFGYDQTGRLTRTTYPTAAHLVTDRAYDRTGKLADLNTHDDSGTVARYQITRDPVGNPTAVVTSRASRTQRVNYLYDQADRLAAACVGIDCGIAATAKIAFTYDTAGNRLNQTLSGTAGNSQTTYHYDSGHQLTDSVTTSGGNSVTTTFAYDRMGNQIRAGSDTFTYNLDHTLASAAVGGNTTQFAYDAQGIRLSATAAGRAQTWRTDVNARLAKLASETITQGASSATRGYLTGPGDAPIGLLAGAQVDSFAPDWLDGVADVMAAQGGSMASYDYDPYGNPRSDGTATGPGTVDNPMRFAGMYQDSALGGRYSTLARTYDPVTGRFSGVDPVPQRLKEPAVSPYAYVGNKPTLYRDPSGAVACEGNYPDHDEAQEMALPQLDARYGAWNVYAECPVNRRLLHGQRFTGPGGVLRLPTFGDPDIVIGLPGVTYVYEVKPAADQLSEIKPGLGERGLNNANQVAGYLRGLLQAGYANPQPGPPIVPVSKESADGSSTLTIFSGVDWSTYARQGARPAANSSGIIYYQRIYKPRTPVPPAADPRRGPNTGENEEPRQNPREVPTTRPADDPVVSVSKEDLILVAAVVVVVAVVVVAAIILAPEVAAAAAVTAFVGWAFSW